MVRDGEQSVGDPYASSRSPLIENSNNYFGDEAPEDEDHQKTANKNKGDVYHIGNFPDN
jgi:hypothetical protein